MGQWLGDCAGKLCRAPHTEDSAGLAESMAICENWRVALREEDGPERPDFDDSDWLIAHVPHNRQEVSNELPRSMRLLWYRNRVRLPAIPPRWGVQLEIFGAMGNEAARAAGPAVWINGERVSGSGQLNLRLVADITEFVRQGDNLLVIRVQSPGIHGGVFVHLLPPLHLAPGELLVDTAGWKGGPASVRARTTIVNTEDRPAQCVVAARVLGPDGKDLGAGCSETVTAGPNARTPVEFRLAPISDPPLWSPAAPQLCVLSASLETGGSAAHSAQTSFGFRWFAFDPDKGFFLNGEPLKLRGTVYVNLSNKKFPSRRALWDYEIGQFKAMGINFLRPAEGLVDHSIYEECDRAGILAIPGIHDNFPPDRLPGILRDDLMHKHNHPCIISWSFNGEGKNASHAARQSLAARILREIDPTRPVTCVELGWRAQGSIGLTDCDIAGQGNYTGWYEGTLDHIGPYMDDFRALVAERYGRPLPVIVSNYGAAADPAVHSNSPRRNDYSTEYHAMFHRRFEREIAARPFVAGSLIFSWRDIDGGQGIPRHTWKGIIDRNERKRDAYYWYQSAWTSEPMVHIAQADFTPRDIWPAGAAKRCEVYSNCESVEFIHNGRSLGAQKEKEGFAWDVSLIEGTNELRAAGRKGGRQVEDSAAIEIRFRPPAPRARLLSATESDRESLRLDWDAVEGAEEYAVYSEGSPEFQPSAESLLAVARHCSLVMPGAERGRHWRVSARAGKAESSASESVGWAEGSARWRFANPGWLFSAPGLADLNGDGKLEIVFGSYCGSVYALDCAGKLLWEFQTAADEFVLGTPAVAPLRPGEAPAIAFSSNRALYLVSAAGRLIWKKTGHRQYDRSAKHPALADVNNDGVCEILAPSDNGQFFCYAADGDLLWKMETSQPGLRGIAQTAPAIVHAQGETRILFCADDGFLRCLDGQGKTLWTFDCEVGGGLPGTAPNLLRPSAAQLEPDGPPRILVSWQGLSVLDLEGRLVSRFDNIGGVPLVADLFHDERRQFVFGSGRNLTVTGIDGRPLWSFALEGVGNFITSPATCADLDDAGRRSILFGARDTHLYALDADGSFRWRFKTIDEVSAAAVVSDIDGDGWSEIVFGGRDGVLRCLAGGRHPGWKSEKSENRLDILDGSE